MAHLITHRSSRLLTYSNSQDLVRRSDQLQKKVALCIDFSFQTQLSDFKHLHRYGREVVLTGKWPIARKGAKLPKNPGVSIKDITVFFENLVTEAIGQSDFNGLNGFVKLLQELQSGKSFTEIDYTSVSGSYDTNCCNTANKVLEVLKRKGISGSLALVRRQGAIYSLHVAAIVQCNDGYCCIDVREYPSLICLALPYGSTLHTQSFSCTAGVDDAEVPFFLTYRDQRNGTQTEEYIIGIQNIEEIVARTFVFAIHYNNPTYSIPIVAFSPVGRRSVKTIGVSLLKSNIVLRNIVSGSTELITFKEARNTLLYNHLKKFNSAEPSCFCTPLDDLIKQIMTIIEGRDIFIALLSDINFRVS